MAQIKSSVTFSCGLRGFHVYGISKDWVPTQGESISFKRELDNRHDRFAVAGQKIFPGKLAPDTIGHVPREISRHVWYAMLNGAELTAYVINASPKRSPLVQGGLEIPVSVSVEWDNIDGLKILMEKVDSVNFPVAEGEEYKEASDEILHEIGDEDDEDSDECNV